MKTAAAIEFAGSPKALAELLTITPSAITQWGDEVPPARQLQLEKLSDGALTADPDAWERVLNPKKQAA